MKEDRSKQNDSLTTYSRFLHYTKFSRHRRSQSIARHGPCKVLKIMSTGGGNTTDDPINNRDLTAVNECGESKYHSECKTQKHLGR
jgi:hypothetical protein